MEVSRSGVGVVTAALAGLAALTAPVPLAADTEVPLGARAIAMGGAFTAVADDITGLFWNPAGLVQLQRQEIGLGHANLFDTGIKDDYVSFGLPLSRQALALDWYHSGLGDGELDFGENRIDLGYGLKLAPRLSLGFTGKFLARHTDLDGSVVREGNGVGLDVGLLANPWRGLALGLVEQDVFDTHLVYTEGGTSVAYPHSLRGAAAYSFAELGKVAVDLDDRLHVGGELTPIPELALRAGLRKELQTDEDFTYSFGAGVSYGFTRFDYAYEIHPALPATHHFGLVLGFNFNPPLISMEQPRVDPLYASLHRAYDSEPFGHVRVTNKQKQDLPIRMRVSIPELDKTPYEYATLLRGDETRDVSLLTVVPDPVMRQVENRPVHVRVEASYQSRRLNRTDRFTTETVIMRPGEIDWANGVGQAAAFITINDPIVEDLAGRVARAAAGGPTGTRDLDIAAATVDALEVLGISYAPDPVTPYSKFAGGGPTLDTIRYPRETLSRRSGDCDDTTVLLAALLGAGGVSCRLVDVPGHLFLLADTGLHPRERLALDVPDAMLVQTDGALWIPIETTALGRGFVGAWSLGSEAYASAARMGPVVSVDVAEAQEKYRPSEAPAGTSRALKGIDPDTLAARLGEDRGKFEQLQAEFWRLQRPTAETPASPSALNELALVRLEAGDPEGADELLGRVLSSGAHVSLARNNLAVAAITAGRLDQAREQLDQALALEPGDPGIWLNLCVVRHLQGDSLNAVRAAREGIRRAGGYEASCRLLGIEVAETPATLETYRSSVDRACQGLLDAISRAGGVAGAASHGPARLYWKR